MSPLGDGVLRQSSLTRSPRPAFTLADELFITVEESTGDPANFSMGLLAVLKLARPIKRRAPAGRFEISASAFARYIYEMDAGSYSRRQKVLSVTH